MQTRSEPRAHYESPVRIFGIDDEGKAINCPAWSVDISRHGARLRGVDAWQGTGQIIGVRVGTEKARYRIVWVGQRGSGNENQLGVVCAEAGKYIWGIAPPVDAAQVRAAAAAAAAGTRNPPPIALSPLYGGKNNRRQDARYRAVGGGRIQETGSRAGQWVTLHDISMGGCYVETTSPLPAGTPVQVAMNVGDIQVVAAGEVTVSHRLVGMGVRFTELSELNRTRLQAVMNALIESGAPAA